MAPPKLCGILVSLPVERAVNPTPPPRGPACPSARGPEPGPGAVAMQGEIESVAPDFPGSVV